ncbi:MAG: chromosome segregation ATPase [Synechococcales bacterium]|nr:chromosome segregation ATPase [Synechococcales bacterium]
MTKDSPTSGRRPNRDRSERSPAASTGRQDPLHSAAVPQVPSPQPPPINRSSNGSSELSPDLSQLLDDPTLVDPNTNLNADLNAAVANLPVPASVPRSRETRQQRKARIRTQQRQGWQHKLLTKLMDWRFLTVTTLLVTGGLTALSLAFLLKLPALPNCPSIFWPLASASLRLHCAEIAANKRTVKDLLEGITLLNTIDKNHPLYEEAARRIEFWSTDILDLSEEKFQAGDLQAAIEAAKQIPETSAASQLVKERIATWEKVWAEAEDISKRIDALLRKEDWREAFVEATRLLSVDNEYWQKQRYQQWSDIITATRADITKLGQAKRALDRNNADDLIKSIEEVATIGEKSYVYKPAQELIPKMGRRMLELAEFAVDRKDYDEALRIANRIPAIANLKDQVDDFALLASAQSRAAQGQVVDLEEAIAQAERISAKRPYYDRAQRLIARWQNEITVVAQLEKAKTLAQSTNPDDLRNAIAEVSDISSSSTRYRDVRQFVDQTTSQIQTTEDGPLLAQADQVAAAGDVNSLKNAIAQAQQIPAGRSLHRQAQDRIRRWSTQIEQSQYQPLLDQANSYAEGGDFSSAIGIAQQVPSSSSLYDQAQSRIGKWQNRMQAEQGLQQAIAQSAEGTPEALLQAIALAQRVPTSSPLRTQANQSMDQWSQQVLQAAQSQAEYDMPGAIALANRIPDGTAAYSAAQAQIAQWKKLIGQV